MQKKQEFKMLVTFFPMFVFFLIFLLDWVLRNFIMSSFYLSHTKLMRFVETPSSFQDVNLDKSSKIIYILSYTYHSIMAN